MILTQAVAAELLGLTTRRLRQLCSEPDPPPKNAEGQFDAAQFGAWMQRRARAEVHAAPDGQTYDYELERARLTHEQADKTALENAVLRAEMVRTPIIEAYWSGLCANFRARLVSLPTKLGVLVDASLRPKLTMRAEALVFEALAEIEQDALTHDLRAAADRSRARGGGTVTEAAAEADAIRVGQRSPDAVG